VGVGPLLRRAIAAPEEALMALVPQIPPRDSDLVREALSVNAIVAARPKEWNGLVRGNKTEAAFYTDAAYGETYPDTPAKIVKGDQAGIDAYNRIALLVQDALAAAAPKNPNYDPKGITWPLKTTPKKAKPGGVFGAKRPWGGTQTRWHAGYDLGAPLGSPVLAPEAGTVVAANSGWDYNAKTQKGVKAIIVASDSGQTWLLGGIRPGSATVKAGERVNAGQKIAEVGAYEGGSTMLHVQLYDAVLTEAQVNKRKSWPKDGPMPANLIDPGPLLDAAAKNTPAAFFPSPEADDADVFGELAEGLEALGELADKLNPPTSSSALGWVLGGLAVVGVGVAVVVAASSSSTPRPRRRAA
jgi:murein DD-endopeptidase MepM/ murein hydrolase activator NlpD